MLRINLLQNGITLNPKTFALEANLKKPTTFQALVQTCQAYNKRNKVLKVRAESNVATFRGNLITYPVLQQSSIVHGYQVFPNVYMITPNTYQSTDQVMQEATQPKVEGS